MSRNLRASDSAFPESKITCGNFCLNELRLDGQSRRGNLSPDFGMVDDLDHAMVLDMQDLYSLDRYT